MEPRHARKRQSRIRAVVYAFAFVVVTMIFWLTGCMERQFYYPVRESTPVPMQFVGAEAVWFNSADGTRLHGWFIPAGTSRLVDTGSGSSPTILHVHGNAGNITSHIGFTDYFPTTGFNLFIFDYRGYGQSEGRATSRGPLIADTNAALDAILARDDVDPDRIAIYGQSLGGSIALNVMAQRPEIRAAVIESAFTSWREIAANAIGGENPNFILRSLAALLIPDSHRADEAIAKVKRPVLLIHGDADSIVPISHSRRLAAAAGDWARLVELPGGDHNTLRETHPEVETIVVDFLREHLSMNEHESL